MMKNTENESNFRPLTDAELLPRALWVLLFLFIAHSLSRNFSNILYRLEITFNFCHVWCDRSLVTVLFFTCCWHLQTISPWHSATEHNNGGLSLRRPHITLENGPVWYHQNSRRRNLPVVPQREGKVWALHTTGLTEVRLSPDLTSNSKSHRISRS